MIGFSLIADGESGKGGENKDDDDDALPSGTKGISFVVIKA